MEDVAKVVEFIGTVINWTIAIILLVMAIFGGSVHVEVKGLNDLITWIKGG